MGVFVEARVLLRFVFNFQFRGKVMKSRSMSKPDALLWSASIVLLFGGMGCGGGSASMPTAGTGTVMVSISDPPSCMPPNGSFTHVFVTVRSVQAHIDPNANDNSSGWQELAPQLASQPMQIDLFSKPQTNCVLAQLGAASLPGGSSQQIPLMLVSNTPAAGTATRAANSGAGHGFNWLLL